MKTRFKIVVITQEKFLNNENSVLCKMFRAGLNLLHLRKPGATKEELKKYLLEIPRQYYKNIVLHDHYGLINEFKLKGAHLTERSRTSKKITNSLKRNNIKIISASFHSVEEIKKSRRKYEYVFLSPVFNSISKNNYKSGFNANDLTPFLKTNKNKIIALGGVNNENILSLKNYGFAGAATIGYVWKSKTPIQNYKKLVSKIK